MTTYAEAIAQAEHRRAIGATDVVVEGPDGIDWSQCVGASSSGGGMLRDAVFTFSASGLRLRWYFELRVRASVNPLTVDTGAVGRVLALLPPGCIARQEFIALLRKAAAELEIRGDRGLGEVQRDYGAAATLRNLAGPVVDEVAS